MAISVTAASRRWTPYRAYVKPPKERAFVQGNMEYPFGRTEKVLRITTKEFTVEISDGNADLDLIFAALCQIPDYRECIRPECLEWKDMTYRDAYAKVVAKRHREPTPN
jgi:hypothetical protein